MSDYIFEDFERICEYKGLAGKWSFLARQISDYGEKGTVSPSTIRQIFAEKSLTGRSNRIKRLVSNWIEENRDVLNDPPFVQTQLVEKPEEKKKIRTPRKKKFLKEVGRMPFTHLRKMLIDAVFGGK